MASAVVFAYHEVGVRCLAVLLAHGVDTRLVVTHRDDPAERVWFGSVAALAARERIATLAPADANGPELHRRIAELAPDFLFSFYYRHLIPERVLALAARGALNLHGSLLPRYRGRAPVNWAVLHGERETGATLHHMTARPDAGDIVDRMAVPILPDDTAAEVYAKVTVAAELVLDRALPLLLAGTAPRLAQDPAAASYHGRRTPEDGRIDWTRPAWAVHNLIRAVAPPYPGAYTRIGARTLRVLRSRRPAPPPPGTAAHAAPAGTLLAAGERVAALCGDGVPLELLELEFDGAPLAPAEALRLYGTIGRPLGA
jgi:methionyl-tRNA formyltransferase